MTAKMTYHKRESRRSVTLSSDSASDDSKTLGSESAFSTSRSATLEPESPPPEQGNEDILVPVPVYFRPVIEEDFSGAEHQLGRVEDMIHLSAECATFQDIDSQVRDQIESHFRQGINKYLARTRRDHRGKKAVVHIENDIRIIWQRPVERRFCLSCTWTPHGHAVNKESWDEIGVWLRAPAWSPSKCSLYGARLMVETTVTVKRERVSTSSRSHRGIPHGGVQTLAERKPAITVLYVARGRKHASKKTPTTR